MTTPTNDDLEELLLSCRYGELEEVQDFVKKFGEEPVATVRDENGCTVLHMTCGNGHLELLEYLLTIVPPTLLSVSNNSKSTALHWATTNKHLDVVKKLVQHPNGPGLALIDQRNAAGLDAVGEAELEEWNEGAQWLISVMDLETDVKEGDTDEVVGESSMDVDGTSATPNSS